AVQAGRELPLEPVLDRPGELARHHDGRAAGRSGGGGGGGPHRETSTRRVGLRARAWATVEPSSAGLGATVRPAERMISAFSAAVSPKAEMMAPACPMRRPFGAVRPATYPITGFVMCSFTNSAASASCGPPISPIIITASVS